MKSFRSWLMGLALGAALMFGGTSAKAQMPRGITYQGVLEQNGVPFSGTASMQFVFSNKSGIILFTQADPAVVVTNGIFNVVIGPFPESMDFNEQYLMTIVVTAGNGSLTTLPATLLWSAPYALNAEHVNGLDVSATPVNGSLFPIPLDSNGKISSSMLPLNSQLQPGSIQTINKIGPNATTGDFQINVGTGIAITPSSNGMTISNIADGSIVSVTGTNGITGGGTAGNIVLGIGVGAITSSMLNPNIGVQSFTAENSSSASPSMIALDSETNGNAAVMVQGGIAANNPGGTADGSGLSSGSPQTYWADAVTVPAATTTSLTIYNKLISSSSTIIVTPVAIAAFGGGITVTSQAAGSFTVSSKNPMGTSSGGLMTALNYIVVNH